MNRLAFSLMIVCLLVAANGCGWQSPKYSPASSQSDSDTPVKWNTDYVPGQIYELQKPVVLVRYHTNIKTDYLILELGFNSNHNFGAPQSIEEYEQKGPKAWPKTRAILPAGTLIRYDETRMYNGGPTMGSSGKPVGMLIANEFSDVGPVDMEFLSQMSKTGNYGYLAMSVDPEMIKPLDQ